MGILDSIVGGLGGSSGGPPGGAASSSAVLSQVLAMLRGQEDAASGLGSPLQAFESGGLGHLDVLGNSGLMQRIAQATGMQPADVAQHLSVVLPQIVDHLTPNGQIHTGGPTGALEGLAQRFLHG